MTPTRKKKYAINAHRVFQILRSHPEGLSTKELRNRLASYEPSVNEGLSVSNGELTLSFEEFLVSCVGPIKAGWLVVERHRWILSKEGIEASEKYRDPIQLITEAGKRSRQGWLAVHFPRAYSTAGKTKDRMISEFRTIRRVGIFRLLKESFGKPVPWQQALPLQSPRTLALPEIAVPTVNALVDHLRSLGAPYAEGGHAIFLPHESVKLTALKSLVESYPPDAGLKIIKNQGGVDESNYVTGMARGDSRIQFGMVHGHKHLSLVANLFYSMGIGPRLYDLINLKAGAQMWTAYVIQDVGSRAPTMSECEAGIRRLRELDSRGLVKVILPEGFDDEEFECPTCCNNAVIDGEGRFQYVDFQNFLLGDYEKFLTDLATEAVEKSHFGDTSVLRGGRYLYQSVPGVKLPGKRSAENRMTILSSLMKDAGVSVEERLVLDIGCNIGMMMAQYLKLDAKWCHGWDRASITPHAERMLLALGCTRFSTTGTDITRTQSLVDDLPMHLRNSLQGCAISYLAVRGHLDWLEALKHIPWSFLIYEGHEGETFDDFDNYLKELRNLTNFELGPYSTYTDGDSEERTVAILLKRV